MKKDELYLALGEIEEKYIDMAESYKPKRKLIRFARLAVAAAVVCLLIIGVGIYIKSQPEISTNESNIPTKQIEANENNLQAEQEETNKISWPIKHVAAVDKNVDEIMGPITENTWSQTGNAGRYTMLSFDSEEYSTGCVIVPNEYKGEQIGGGKVVGQDMFSMEIHEMNVDVYEIKSVSTRCAVAVYFTEPDQSVTGNNYVYAYINPEYLPDTLEDFINDLNLAEQMDIGLAYMYNFNEETTVTFENVDKKNILELMKENLKSVNVSEENIGDTAISIAVKVLGMNKSITLTEDGYLWTNILETGKCFFIGKDKVDTFVDYVINNCDGYIYVYDVESDGVAE